MKIALVTGGFDPLHSGHISFLKQAASLGDKLWVGLNSDQWLERKKGAAFLPYADRFEITNSLKMVDKIIPFSDEDGTACDAIDYVLSTTSADVVFANGGDRNNKTTPEYKKYMKHPQVNFVFGVGGYNKQNSSSWILDKWKTNKTERDWGYWRVLDDKGIVKTKELVIYPGESLSNQRHFHRAEHWYVLTGTIELCGKVLSAHDTFIIDKETWHQAKNIGKDLAHIIEVQYGEFCVEEDIERC